MSTDNTAVVTLTLPIPDQLCLDLLTTAVEGGSAYWLAADRIERMPESDDATSLCVTKIVNCFDREEENEAWGDADIETIRLGIKRIVECGDKPLVRSDIRGDLIEVLMDGDNANWDAETADCVLQVGLLCEVVYG